MRRPPARRGDAGDRRTMRSCRAVAESSPWRRSGAVRHPGVSAVRYTRTGRTCGNEHLPEKGADVDDDGRVAASAPGRGADPLADHPIFRTTDPELAIAHAGAYFSPHRM